MGGEFVNKKSSRWGNSSKSEPPLFFSSPRNIHVPQQQIPVDISGEIPEPVFLKSVLNSRRKGTPVEDEQENLKEQGGVNLKSDSLQPTDGGELLAQANTPKKSQQDKSDGEGGWLPKSLHWVWGVAQGDFNSDPDTSQIVIRTLITLIPGIDQVADIQDLTAALYKLAWKQQYDEVGPWFDLFITGIGFVPALGSALKGVVKILKKGEKADVAKIGKLLGGVANNLDDFSAFTDIAAKSVKQKIGELTARATQTASALRLVPLDPTGGKIKQLANKLDSFAQSLEDIRGLVDEKFREIGWEIQRRLDELLGGKGVINNATNGKSFGANQRGLSPNVEKYWDEYYEAVGKQGDNLQDIVDIAKNKGINIGHGAESLFDSVTGEITLSSNAKKWEFYEEFLHKKVAEGWKSTEIATLTKKLRKVKDFKGHKSVKSPARSAEEIVVKQWLLRHGSLVGVGKPENILLQNQIDRLSKYGTARGY